MTRYQFLSGKLTIILVFAFCCFGLCQSCTTEDNVSEYSGIIKPNGKAALEKELSADRSTIFSNAADAYDTDSYWVSENQELSRRFNKGDDLYDSAYGIDLSTEDIHAAAATKGRDAHGRQ